MSKRFFTKINKNGRLVIIDKECHIEIIDLTLACEVLNRLDLKLKHYNEVNGEQQFTIQSLKEENEQLHYKLQQTGKYLQTKIDECKNHKKMKEIVFGVEQAVGYEKALLQFQKGLKRRLNDE